MSYFTYWAVWDWSNIHSTRAKTVAKPNATSFGLARYRSNSLSGEQAALTANANKYHIEHHDNMGWLYVITYSTHTYIYTYIYNYIHILYNSEISYAHRIQTSRLQHDLNHSGEVLRHQSRALRMKVFRRKGLAWPGHFKAVVIDQWGELNN